MKQRIHAVLFPLYLALYDKLKPERRKALLPFLDEVRDFLSKRGIDVVDCGILTKPQEVRRAAKLAADADLIITLHLSYSPSLLVADTLQKLGRPILMLDTTKADRFDARSTAADIGENHGIHGVMDLASVLKSRRVPFEIVAGSLRTPKFASRTDTALRALKAASLFLGQRIGLTGKPFAGMGDFAVDFSELKRRFGTRIENVSVSSILSAGKKISKKSIDEHVQADRKHCTLHAVDAGAHAEAVRDYLALSAIVARRKLDGYSMNFQYIRSGIATPFYACSRLMSDGVGYAGEGDVLTALLGRPLNFLAGEAFFGEMFCPDWQGGTLLMAHMGETDVRFSHPKIRPTLAQKKALMNDRFSVYPLPAMAECEVTVVNLVRDADRGFRFIVTLADIVRFPVKVEFGMPHFKLKPKLPLAEFLERYGREGGGHHIFLARGDQRQAVEIMARQLGTAFASV